MLKHRSPASQIHAKATAYRPLLGPGLHTTLLSGVSLEYALLTSTLF